jgi:D-proline reductase (dithiol) PrdB
MTTGISLVRENTVSMKPPRSLWVSFPLGRPLGIPLDASFQHRVIKAALNSLSNAKGPVFEDFLEDVPTIDETSMTTCQVSFPKNFDDDSWKARLVKEYMTLQP